MAKGLHKVFKTVVKYILYDLPPFGESGSEVSHFTPEPRNFAGVTKLSDDIKKPWLKATSSFFWSGLPGPIACHYWVVKFQPIHRL